jgi:hypothetical protein
MTFALISTIMSSICLALMVTFDRLMVGDCYQGKPNQAWFVSSAAGSLFGLVLTAFVWFGVVAFGHVDSLQTLFSTAANLAVSKGIIMMLVGGLSVQVLLHYFRCFGEEANSAAVAAWLAATPIFIFMALFVFSSLTGDFQTLLTQPLWIVGVVLATAGLVAFEQLSSGGSFKVKKTYRKELALMLLFNVLYAIVLKEVLTTEAGNSISRIDVLALLPFYWLGFAAGMRVIFKKGEWQTFKSNWKRRIRHFLVPILIVEVVGMLVFYFEYLGISELDPVFVNIILGAHIFLVYVLDLLLGRVRRWMSINDMRKLYFLGIRLLQSKLPRPEVSPLQMTLELAAIVATVGGIVLTSIYSL